jgi:hypothetical protein
LYLKPDVNTPTSVSSKYSPSSLIDSKQSKSANGAIEYKRLMYKDFISGKINHQQLAKAKSQVRQKMLSKSSTFNFVEEGPDNVGGRTRAIAIHPNNDDIMFAGSVTGGLFKSTNGGNNWNRVQEFDDAMLNSATGTGSLGISSITITNDTVLYVATGGSKYEGSLYNEGSANITGDGIWFSNSVHSMSFSQLYGTNNSDILKVVADPTADNTIFYVGSEIDMNGNLSGFGLKKFDNTNTTTISNFGNNNTALDFKISEDGTTMVFGYQLGTRIETVVSQDGGTTWTNMHSNGQLDGFGNARVEYSISGNKNTNGNYVIYAVFASNSGTLGGVHRSDDNGLNWFQIGQYTNGFTPLSTSLSQQGNYDLVILSSQDGESCILGGIDLYKWQHAPGASTASGQWNQETYWFAPSWAQSSNFVLYAHADNHRLLYNGNGDLIVGNDGGIQKIFNLPFGSVEINQVPLNKGYNVTQFYSMAFDGEGSVLAGAQDNGTQYKDNTLYNYWPNDFNEVSGGDGFECAISYLNNNAMITTVYNGSINRSNDRGATFQQVNVGTPQTDPFYNALALMETANDLNTKDSVLFSPDLAKSAGDTITYNSSTLDIPIKHVLTQDLNVYNTYDTVITLGDTDVYVTRDSTDTLILPDYIQSYFVTQRGPAVYATRDILRFTTNPTWWKLFDITGNNMHSYEISTDMNYAWCGSYSGNLQRVSGLANAYSLAAADIDLKPTSSDSLVLISTGDTLTGSNVLQINFETDYLLYNYIDGSPVEYCLNTKSINLNGTISDISIDPTNPDIVCVVTGGTGSNNVYYSTNATSSNPTFTVIDGDLPNMPVFGCVVEKDPATDVILLGTEYGIFSTNSINGTNTQWTPNNLEIGPIPVFDICQQWRDWEDGFANGIRRVRNPGAIYACTFGRGIWRADNLLSTAEPIEFVSNNESLDISLFPNPVSDNANISFTLNSNSDLTVQVFDLNGRVIKSIYNDQPFTAGRHNENFNVNDLPLGTYIVLVKSNTDQKVVKFIKY